MCQFCRTCVTEWFGTRGKNKCPVCNVVVGSMLFHGQPVSVPKPACRPTNTSDNEKKTMLSSPPTKPTTSAFQTPTLEESPSKTVTVLLDDMSPTKIERIPAIKRCVLCGCVWVWVYVCVCVCVWYVLSRCVCMWHALSLCVCVACPLTVCV